MTNNNHNKIAVFGSSEIQNGYDTHLPVVHTTPDGQDIYSTGALEEALILEGCCVHVASTREGPGDHDRWWIQLVESRGGRVFWGRSPCETADEYGAGWRALFHHLGETWPVEDGEAVHWQGARFALLDRGYRLGHQFNDRKRRMAARREFLTELQEC